MNPLTDTFSIDVMTHSDTAKRLKIPNVPTPEVADNLRALYDNLLFPLVKALPGTINVTVAYRSNKLNATLKGAPGSQHVKGMAADVEYYEEGKEDNRKIIDTVKALNLDFDQMIEEKNNPKTNQPSWVHLSYNKVKNRRQHFKL